MRSHQQLQTLHLHSGAGKTIQHATVAKVRLQHLAQQDAEDLAISHHLTRILDGARLRGGEQIADDDGRAGESPRLHDEPGVGSLSRSRARRRVG